MDALDKNPSDVPPTVRRKAARLNDLGVMLDAAGHKKEALLAFKKALLSNPSSYIPYFNIGNIMRDLDQTDRAIYFYEKAISLNPDDLDIYLNLAPLYSLKKADDKALATYRRVLAVNPENCVARHFLMALQGQTPAQPPLAYVERLFDDYAGNFEEHLTTNLKYNTPDRLAGMIFETKGASQIFARGLDMGCGTGLLGGLLRPHCTELIGVDLSRGMLQQAAARGCYDLTLQTHIVNYLASAGMFDLTAAADMLPYFGDLSPLFHAVAAHCLEGGLFAFSTESANIPDYTLAPTGRYQHGRAYIESLLTECGFAPLAVRCETLRLQGAIPLVGDLFIARRC